MCSNSRLMNAQTHRHTPVFWSVFTMPHLELWPAVHVRFFSLQEEQEKLLKNFQWQCLVFIIYLVTTRSNIVATVLPVSGAKVKDFFGPSLIPWTRTVTCEHKFLSSINVYCLWQCCFATDNPIQSIALNFKTVSEELSQCSISCWRLWDAFETS